MASKPLAPRHRRPGNRAGLTADAVLAAGRDLVQHDGADALTMRRVAERLGVAPNALYSHFADKATLVDAVFDSLLDEVDATGVDDADWRAGLVALMVASRSMLLNHADLFPHLMSRPMRGPNARSLGEGTLGLLARGGIEGPPAVEALRALLTFTFGSVVLDAPRRSDPDPEDRAARSRAAFATSAETPRVAGLAELLARPPDAVAFETSLGWLIDGIARTVERD